MPKFDSDLMLEIIEKDKIQFLHIVPPIIIGLVNNPNVDKYDLSSLRGIRTASAPMGKDHLNKFYRIFKDIGVVRAYGLTETSPTLTNSFMHHPNDGSSGVLLSNVEAKVIDKQGNLLGYNQEGELCFRGPNIMLGYLNNPEANRLSLDKDGFFHTGDTGFVDKQGNFHIVGRIKDLIKYKGLQVAPPELEGLLLDHPDVVDSAVIGIDSEELATELPKAYITLATKYNNLTEQQKTQKCLEVRKWVDEQVAPHKRLRGGVEIINNIPKNPSGKVLKGILREMEKDKMKIKSLKPSL
ncbi:hypothetical protein BB560_003681 [Smittium megazygosporum]|uniref:AMP-dependent synthetase/ligase domain-containing protein n=1 Tax=Smittium megazygosporum TaxID=133381 RepID=A0A2T9ZBF0_9FUNG|nr:hypothetical protein BB560_003681 [Smittium megazygosporum]